MDVSPVWGVLKLGHNHYVELRHPTVKLGKDLCPSSSLCPEHATLRWCRETDEFPSVSCVCESGESPSVRVSICENDDADSVTVVCAKDDHMLLKDGGACLVMRETAGGMPTTIWFLFIANLPSEHYEWRELLGAGTQAQVKAARNRRSGEIVAAKIFNKSTVLSHGKTVAAALSECVDIEASILSQIRHPNIISLHETIVTDHHLILILDLNDGPDLFTLLQQRCALHDGGAPFSDSEAHAIFTQMVDSVVYLHRHGICHRDIKPSNFLTSTAPDGSIRVRLTDFGTAKVFGHHQNHMYRVVYSPMYISPEMLVHRELGFGSSQGYTEEIDVWSLGVCLYNILTGLMPFDCVEDILAGKFDADIISDPLARNLCVRMLTVDPNTRITMDNVLEHEWMFIRDKKRQKTHE
jgi:serine/threonine protein kinase